MLKSSVNKDSVLTLLKAAAALDDDRQRDAFFASLIDRVLRLETDPEILNELIQRESKGRGRPAQLNGTQIPAEAFGYSEGDFQVPRGTIKGSTKALSVAAVDQMSNYSQNSQSGKGQEIVKRGRGRPRKIKDEKVELHESLKCLQLLDDFNIEDPRLRKILEEIAKAAAQNGGRGIPETEGFDNYRALRRGGPRPVERVFNIEGKIHRVEPPIIAKGGKDVRDEMNSIWIEFEKHLLSINDLKFSKAEINERQQKIGYKEGLKGVGIKWVEDTLSDGSVGIPTINAETARNILRAIPDCLKFGELFIDQAPASWVTEKGEWTYQFSLFMRDVWYGNKKIGRKGKFALARLLMQPLGNIERKLMDVAFPEIYEDKNEKEKNLEARSDDFGRRKSSKKRKELKLIKKEKNTKASKNAGTSKDSKDAGGKKKRGRPRKILTN